MQTIINVNKENGRTQALSTWHPINNAWVHIFQIFNADGSINYFVNGVEQETPTELFQLLDKTIISPKITDLEGFLQEFDLVETEIEDS